MKVQQYEKDKLFIYELDSDGKMRWSLAIHSPNPPESKGPVSQEELEWISDKIVQALDGKDFNSWGCYCDLEPGQEPHSTCVIDDNERDRCAFASGRKDFWIKRKEDCPLWRRV